MLAIVEIYEMLCRNSQNLEVELEGGWKSARMLDWWYNICYKSMIFRRRAGNIGKIRQKAIFSMEAIPAADSKYYHDLF